MKKQTHKPASKKNITINTLLLFGIFVSVTIALSALWVNNSFFRTEKFSNTVTTSLTSESSRTAIAAEATDRILADRPVARRLLGGKITSLLAASLNSGIVNNSIDKLSQRVQLYMTSSDQQSIVLEIGGMKDIVDKFAVLLDKEDGAVATTVSNVPDTIVLVDEEKIPSLYNLSLVFLWLGPLAAIIAIASIAYVLYRNKNMIYRWVYAVGAVLLTTGLFGLLYGPLFRPPITNSAKTINGRVVIGNLYDAFMGQFVQYMYALMYFALAILAVTLVIQYFKKFKTVFFK